MSAWIEELLRDPDARYRDVVLAALALLVAVLLLRALARPRAGFAVGKLSRLLRLAFLLAVLAAAGTAFGAVLRGEALHGRLLFAHLVAAGAIVALFPLYALGAWARSFSGVLALLSGLAAIAPMLVAMQPIGDTALQHELLTLHRYGGLLFLVTLVLARPRRSNAPLVAPGDPAAAAPGAASHR
ncbi:MAG: hypothetical protein JNM84_22740 [Planctomycetes bacterium]|nr:hypothetical protein [Planctomycetota bacterium]